MNIGTRPLCTQCKAKPRAYGYRKGTKIYWRRLCDGIGRSPSLYEDFAPQSTLVFARGGSKTDALPESVKAAQAKGAIPRSKNEACRTVPHPGTPRCPSGTFH